MDATNAQIPLYLTFQDPQQFYTLINVSGAARPHS